MPVGQVYTVIGDANIRRNATAMNLASREAMANAKFIDCKEFSKFAQSLRDVSSDTTVCLIQSVTSFLVATANVGTVFGTIDPVLTEFALQVRDFCSARPSIQVLVAPPMYQFVPFWYRKHLPEVSKQFSTILTSNRSRNLYLLSNPICQELCDDGCHLTPVAGLHYMISLFDEAGRIVANIGAKGTLLMQSFSLQ